MSSNPKYKKTPASAPFDKTVEDADFILRTSDGVDFHVLTAILRIGSSVFKDMFIVATGPNSTTTQVLKDPSSDDSDPPPEANPEQSPLHPLITVTECSYILDLVLRIIYPVTTPKVQTLDTIIDVLHAGSKYHMEAVTTQMASELLLLVKSKPVPVYSIACQFSLEDVARTAANSERIVQLNLESNLHKWRTSVGRMTAGQLYRLLWFLKKRSSEKEKGSEIKFIEKGSFREIGPVSISAEAKTELKSDTFSDSCLLLDPELFCRIRPDVTLRSSDQVEFRAHRFILTLESPIFANRLESVASEDVLQMTEDSSVVSLILQFCYNDPTIRYPPSSNIDILHKTIVALREYQMSRLIDRAKRTLLDREKVHPLEAYFIAIACGWDEEAKKMAKILVSNDSIVELYAIQMEKSSARSYQRLLSYRSDYIEAVRKILQHGIQDNKVNCLVEVLSRQTITGSTDGWRNVRTVTFTSQQISGIQNDYTDIGQKLDLVKKELANINLDDIMS